MTNERYRQVRAIVEALDELSDAAFIAACEKAGVSIAEICEYSDEHQRQTQATGIWGGRRP